MNDNNAVFGKVLRQYRTAQRLSQDALAASAGLSRQFISLLEMGQRSPTLDTILKLCAALNISLAQIGESIDIMLKESDGK
jgi:transcriptional regulator with XRE-family HTH domain